MPRQKHQRPEVYLTGKREKVWKAEYREYYIGANGKEQSRHKSATWSKANHTKAEAQKKCDALMLQLGQGGPRADGSMTLEDFWDRIYYPVRAARWEWNSRRTINSLWKLHIRPQLGPMKLEDITKATVDLHLLKMAESGKGDTQISLVLDRLRSVFWEALENEYIRKNPARKVLLPKGKPAVEVRSLTVEEVRRLLTSTSDMDHLIWHVLLLTGARIGEVFALDRADLLPQGLLIDESVVNNGTKKCTKNRKTRLTPITDDLRAELEVWLASHTSPLIFPASNGSVLRRSSRASNVMVKDARTAAGISDLTFRMCRTTFATLFPGDIKDAQEILGHHSEEFTRRRYQKSIPERAAAAVKEMGVRFGKKVVEINKAQVEIAQEEKKKVG